MTTTPPKNTKPAPKKKGKSYAEQDKIRTQALDNVKDSVKNTGKIDQGAVGEKAGYSPSYAKTGRWLKSDSFREKFNREITDEKVINWHKQLGGIKKLDHMVFPIALENELIEELITSTGNVLRKIVEGTQAKHVYFWTFDSKALKDAIDIAHKIKGSYAPIKVETDDSPMSDLSDTELAEEIKNLQNFFLKKAPKKEVKKPETKVDNKVNTS